MQLVKSSRRFTASDRLGHNRGNARICQPLNATPIPVQSSVFRHEGLSGGQQNVTRTQRHASMQSPGKKNRRTFGVDMWQSSAIFEHSVSKGRRKRLPHSGLDNEKFSGMAAKI
jgi:hypothetical protein